MDVEPVLPLTQAVEAVDDAPSNTVPAPAPLVVANAGSSQSQSDWDQQFSNAFVIHGIKHIADNLLQTVLEGMTLQTDLCLDN